MTKIELLQILNIKKSEFETFYKQIETNREIPKDYIKKCRSVENLVENFFGVKELQDFIDYVREDEKMPTILEGTLSLARANSYNEIVDEESEEVEKIDDVLEECNNYIEAIENQIETVSYFEVDEIPMIVKGSAGIKHGTGKSVSAENTTYHIHAERVNFVHKGMLNIGSVVDEYADLLRTQGVTERHVIQFNKAMEGATSKKSLTEKFDKWLMDNAPALSVYIGATQLAIMFTELMSKLPN